MEEFFFNNFGITPNVLNYLVLPLLIFIARIGDVSISTIHIIFLMSGNRLIAPILGFFEALIWLLAIGQIISNIDNVWSYIAYASGFAAGTFIGMTIEKKLAYGNVVLRLFVKDLNAGFISFLEDLDYRYSVLPAAGRRGKVDIVFMVFKRDRLKEVMKGVDIYHPHAFYTIEGVNQVSKPYYFDFDEEEAQVKDALALQRK